MWLRSRLLETSLNDPFNEQALKHNVTRLKILFAPDSQLSVDQVGDIKSGHYGQNICYKYQITVNLHLLFQLKLTFLRKIENFNEEVVDID